MIGVGALADERNLLSPFQVLNEWVRRILVPDAWNQENPQSENRDLCLSHCIGFDENLSPDRAGSVIHFCGVYSEVGGTFVLRELGESSSLFGAGCSTFAAVGCSCMSQNRVPVLEDGGR